MTSVAFEQLFLMSEIEKFHPFDPQLTSGLEKWLMLHCGRTFYDHAKSSKLNDHMLVDNIITKQQHHKHDDKKNETTSDTNTHEYMNHEYRDNSRGMQSYGD